MSRAVGVDWWARGDGAGGGRPDGAGGPLAHERVVNGATEREGRCLVVIFISVGRHMGSQSEKGGDCGPHCDGRYLC